MKIYIQNNTPDENGFIVVVAKNEKQARDLMRAETNYNPDEHVVELKIEIGVLYKDSGE